MRRLTIGTWYRFLALSVCVWLLSAAPAQLRAQQDQTASITGTVFDSHGAAVANASVAAKNQTTNALSKVNTDGVGHFAITGIPAGRYALTISAKGFGTTAKSDVAAAVRSQDISVTLGIQSFEQSVEVQAVAGDSIAGQHALSQGSLDTVAPESAISNEFIREFTPPTTDYSEIINIAPGTISYNPNGVGLGQGTIYFRGFQDGDFDITWDGIPFNDSNNPTHHSWAFFPGPWIGSVNFDRSPGTASTIGQATYGGSINLLSPEVPSEQSVLPQVSYGSFNTLLIDGQYNTGMLGPRKNIGLTLDVHRITSNGFETLNYLERNAGDIKVLYKLSDRTVITGYSGVVHLFGNAPNVSPYRAQINAYGWNYLLQNNDPTSAFFQKYNTNTVPTDFEYVGIHSSLNRGWQVDVKPYTYSYNNAQYYANDNPNDTTGLATGPNGSSGWITPANCEPEGKIWPCAIDKVNSYRKYGETSTISQTSKYGVFRTGMWYEWATSNRFQFPSDPINHLDQAVPNFHENYWTNSYNPYVEYEWHATKKLTLIVGDKYAYYTLNFKQFADNGKVVGNLNGAPSITSSGGFGSNLPSASANYRLTNNWSVYGQFGKGDEIPPTSIFDVAGGGKEISKLPSPQTTSAYQGGTVLKLNRVTFDADYYAVKFQNNYIQNVVTNPNNPAFGLNEYFLGPDSITQGFEAETNASLGYGLNVYANGTIGKATYTGIGVPSGLNVTDTPSYTQGLGVTYQGHGMDLGIIEKRVGSYYDDNGSFHNQVYVAPYNNVNLFLNYTIRKHSMFDESKISFSINNLFNSENITDVFPFNSPTPAGTSAYIATTTPSPLDQINLTAGRSFVVTFKMGLFPNRHE
ncbi:iron complex outermembrane receptor protein [Silvibacterium bohemicum]|uniref:Iron complex outermembrane receptor protein n=1 Tax=Silvibacterium bohemicum TaxID=1577686 RepID=A0A841JNJ1_9BACT|nr:TonB-dependent receptor [Silvibacterium bohemicum]MBB6142710.1 iron complex outermembrane receptor protein [Silvibacterium bohemicum]